MRHAIALLLLALATPAALAQSPTIETYNCGYQVVRVGVSIGKLTAACGQPTRVANVENTFGAVAGERWEYHRTDGSVVLFYVAGATIRRIERAR
jgi:hypothetical protein